MADFDPYHKWLGIPPAEQPPNHYRLLGIPLFETDAEVIEAAADQRMAFLQQCATGQHLRISQKLLNEVATARVCLLSPERKAGYDEMLRHAATRLSRPDELASAGKRSMSRIPLLVGGAVLVLFVVLFGVWIFGVRDADRTRRGDAAASASRESAEGSSSAPIASPARDADEPVAESATQPADEGPDVAVELAAVEPAAAPAPGDKKSAEATAVASDEAAPAPAQAVLPAAETPPAAVAEPPASPPVEVQGSDVLGEAASGTNLLEVVDPVRDASNGRWELTAEGLVSPLDQNARIQIPYEFPQPYVFTAVVERLQGDETLELALPIQDRQMLLVLNGWGGRVSGIHFLDFKEANANETTGENGVLPDSSPHTVVCTVRRDGISATIDGRVFLDWSGNVERIPENYGGATKTPWLSIRTAGVSYRISRMTVRPLVTATEQVPDRESLRQAELAVRQKYRDEFARTKPVDKSLLAATLLDRVQIGDDESSVRYVLLTECARIAAEMGDVKLSLRAVDEITERFQADEYSLKADALATAARNARSVDECVTIAAPLLDLAREAVRRNRFGVAHELAKVMLTISRKVSEIGLREELRSRALEIEVLHRAWDGVKSSMEKAQSDPADGKAALDWGRFLCFTQGNWQSGLPVLARSGDPVLQALAARSLAAESRIDEFVALGEAWWEIAEKEREQRAQRNGREYAASLYERALVRATDAQRPMLEQRIARKFGTAPILETIEDGAPVPLGVQGDVGLTSTVECWFKTSDPVGILLTKRQTEDGSSLTLWVYQKHLCFSGDGPFYRVDGDSNVPVNDGLWHHAAMVKRGQDAKLFLDGRPVVAIETLDKFASSTPWAVGVNGNRFGLYTAAAQVCRVRISSIDRYHARFEPDPRYAADKYTQLFR